MQWSLCFNGRCTCLSCRVGSTSVLAAFLSCNIVPLVRLSSFREAKAIDRLLTQSEGTTRLLAVPFTGRGFVGMHSGARARSSSSPARVSNFTTPDEGAITLALAWLRIAERSFPVHSSSRNRRASRMEQSAVRLTCSLLTIHKYSRFIALGLIGQR